MNEAYDVRGAVHKLEQRKPRKHLQHLPDHQNFDVEFSPSGKILEVTSCNGKGVRIAIERFFYDDSERITRSIKLNGELQETSVTDFAYPSKDKHIATTTDVSTKEISSRAMAVYDGVLLVSSATYDGNGHLKIDKTFAYEGGRLCSSKSRYYIPNGGLSEQSASTYDSAGRIAETYGLKPDGSPLGDGKYRFEYDDQGRQSRVWTFPEFGDDPAASGVQVFEYTCDDHANWVERREFHKFRSDQRWWKDVTTRKLIYYPES